MAQITKGVRLRVAPRRYEWFEVWTEAKVDVNQPDHAAHQDVFQQVKQECISDAQDVLRSLNLPEIDFNIVSSIQGHVPDNINNINNVQYNLNQPNYSQEEGIPLPIQNNNSVPNDLSQMIKYGEVSDPALEIEANLPVHGVMNRIPDIG